LGRVASVNHQEQGKGGSRRLWLGGREKRTHVWTDFGLTRGERKNKKTQQRNTNGKKISTSGKTFREILYWERSPPGRIGYRIPQPERTLGTF